MNDFQIMEYIAANPRTTAGRVADRFDVELIEASKRLRPLVEVGDLVQAKGFAPNGSPAQVYTVSEEFFKTADGKAIAARLRAEKPAQATNDNAAAGAAKQQASASNDRPYVGAVEETTAASRPERVIAHIKAVGPICDADVRLLLDMPMDEFPSTVLRHAVKTGRIKRVGANWELGDGKAPEPLKRQPAFGGALGLAGATPHPKAEKPRARAEEGSANREVPAPVAQITGLRCGTWSDGVTELQRDGVTICILARDEVEFLVNYISHGQAARIA